MHLAFRPKSFTQLLTAFEKKRQLSITPLTFPLILSKQVMKSVDNFIFKLITNYNQHGDPRSFCYEYLFSTGIFLENHLLKYDHLLYLHFIQTDKWTLIETGLKFWNFKY